MMYGLIVKIFALIILVTATNVASDLFPSSAPSGVPSSVPISVPTSVPSGRPSLWPSVMPTSQPTSSPSLPTSRPSGRPTVRPSSQPSGQPTNLPITSPTVQPSCQPSARPTLQPSAQPTIYPTSQPSIKPTGLPSAQPSFFPTSQPTNTPTREPSVQPSSKPSRQPTSVPSCRPTTQPTANPTNPTGQPTSLPSGQPSGQPSSQPTCPTGQPSASPTHRPSSQPSMQPSTQPSARPSGQPTRQPTNPTSRPTRQPTTQPSSQPTSVPTNPTGQPTSSPTSAPTEQISVKSNWVFDPNYGLSLTIIVGLSINGCSILYSIFAMYSYGIEASSEGRKLVCFGATILITFMNFVFLCARFNYFLNAGTYELLATADGEHVWVGEQYYSANVPTLKRANCPYSVLPNGDVAALESVANTECRWMLLTFSGDLLDGMAKFSIGLGLLIYLGLLCVAMVVKLVMRDAKVETEGWLSKLIAGITGHAFQYIVVLVVTSQQFCVLMLLTNVKANNYCAEFIVPIHDVRKAMCYYQWGVHSLPWAIIFSLCAAAAAAVGYGFANAKGDERGQAISNIIACIALVAGALCAIHAISLIAYWLLAGFGIGVWFQFAALEITGRYVLVEGLSLSVFIISDLLEFSVGLLSNICSCGATHHPIQADSEKGPGNTDEFTDFAASNAGEMAAAKAAEFEMRNRKKDGVAQQYTTL